MDIKKDENDLFNNNEGEKVGGHKPDTWLSQIVTASCVDDRMDALKVAIKDFSKKDINKKDTAGMTALHFAVAHKNVTAVNILLDNGADVNIPDDHGFTPLYMATGRYADYDVATMLLKRSEVKVNCVNYNGATPLHGAAHIRNPDTVSLLIRHGANVNNKTRDGATPLDLAGDHMATITALKTTRCVECGDQPETGLKTCGQCQGPLYCGKECQRKHWKDGGHKRECGGHVWAYPHKFLGSNEGFVSTIHHKDMTLSTSSTSRMKNQAKHMNHDSRFMVKVQLPLTLGVGSSSSEPMMVYNKDRSLTMLISPKDQEKGFTILSKKIRSDGFMGVKAFFWAELPDTPDLKMKVSYKTCAPFQQW